ncbi:MAG: alpha/beta fold hydrolase [Candidatus Aminicenantes bacterium]|nr:alpha/beta fold hydrolase [Candidatus Aminicenantes bacterium]
MKIFINFVFVVSLSLLIILATACQKTVDDQGPSASPKGYVESADGVSIHYKTTGQGDMTLVFVHGWCTDMSYWDGQIPSFKVYYQVVTLDLAGHGRSGAERTSWTIEAFAQDVAAVVEKLDLQKVVLIGHALAGPVVLEAARLLPGRVMGIIGADSMSDIYLSAYSPEQIEAALLPFQEDFAEGVRMYVLENYFRSTASDRIKRRIVLDMTETPADVGLGALEELMKYDATVMLQELNVPVRSINADRPLVYFRLIRKNHTNFTLKFMKNAGHFMMIESPQEFNRLLADFLGQIILESYRQ